MRGATNSTPISIETIDLSTYSLGTAITITDIGKKIAECDYYIISWHDTRHTDIHMASVLPGHIANSFSPIIAIHEYYSQSTPYIGGLTVQNYSANIIIINSNVIMVGSSTWVTYNGLIALESIKIVKKGGGRKLSLLRRLFRGRRS